MLTWTVGLPGSSHAETALARGRNVRVSLNGRVIEAGVTEWRIAGGGTSTGHKDVGADVGRNLVRDCGLKEGRGSTEEEGKEEGGNGGLHHLAWGCFLRFSVMLHEVEKRFADSDAFAHCTCDDLHSTYRMADRIITNYAAHHQLATCRNHGTLDRRCEAFAVAGDDTGVPVHSLDVVQYTI